VAPSGVVVDRESVRTLGHVPALDGLRGIAILLVLAAHSNDFLPGGRLGVDLFFVLSGFLITSLLLQEWGREGSISLGAFYRRRALRLFPALYGMLLVYAVFVGVVAEQTGWERSVVYGGLYVYNVAHGWLGHTGVGIDHLWTLAAEEQFYLVWPPLLVLALRRSISPRALIATLLVLAAAIAVWRGVLVQSVHYGPRMVGPDVRADPLLLGCLAGLVYGFGLVRRVPLGLASVLGVLGAVLALSVREPAVSYHVVVLPLFCACAAVVVYTCAAHRAWWLARLVSHEPLRWFGKISYGLYIWHFPLFALVGWQLGIPLSIAVAAISYRYVERPFLRRRHTRRELPGDLSRPAPVSA
jgi:peptidoglycan/LPS O-acetylase OafA/YrhL